MKFIHLSDLHLGKRVNEFSMLEDQQYILGEILKIIDAQRPQAIIIAGDVYDKSVPSAEAVQLLDEFLVSLSRRSVETFLISGNHDSAERVAFGGRLMERSGLHLSPVYDGTVTPITLTDEYGPVNFYLLPFLRPSNVRRFYEEESIETYTDAIAAAIAHMDVDTGNRNVLVSHQFVTGAVRCDSETVSVGGTDNVDVSVFAPFDYVALGHIHGPQSVERETVRYCGTPLKYSFSEKDHHKSVTVVELGEKGQVSISTVPLTPLHDLRELRGTYEELTLRKNYEGTATEDYLHIILTDENDVPNAMGRLRTVYPNVMAIDYDNLRTRTGGLVGMAEKVEQKSGLELLAELYEKQNGQTMDPEQRAFAAGLFEAIQEEMA